MTVQVFGRTDVGRERPNNQDAFVCGSLSEQAMYAGVCDGMGGANGGQIASTKAVQVVSDRIVECYRENMTDNSIRNLLETAIAAANAEVFDTAKNDADLRGMGTTVVATIVCKQKAHIAHVGDSRAYLINENGIRQVTRDHSVVEDLVSSGKLSREEARNHPRKNLITRALGCEPQLRADLFHVDVAQGDHLLLCSDGLSNQLAEQEILYEVIHGGEGDTCCQRLLDIAMHRGAPDNVTVVLVRC